MAKQSLFGSGKNAVQQTSHIRSTKVPGGNQGFSSNRLGNDTEPGPARGAPLSTQVKKEVSTKKVLRDGMNPFNDYEGDAKGVLGPNVVAQNAGRTPDDPVPDNAPMPNLAIRSKAALNAGLSSEAQFPADGVMHRD